MAGFKSFFILILTVSAGLLAILWRDNFDFELLTGSRVLLTGASRGIGEQMAYHYARFGAELVITARNETRLKQVAEKCLELGAKKVYSYPVDMSLPMNPELVVQFALEKLGSLDYLVLNHIGYDPFQMWNGNAENVSWLMQVNFLSYVRLTAAAFPTLIKNNGSIVVISSLCGKLAIPYAASYSASKFALDGFFTSLRHELALQGRNVSITLCILGMIDTDSTMEKVKTMNIRMMVSPASESALAIIKGGAVRAREIYYPWWIALTVSVRDWFPEMRDKVIRSSFAGKSKEDGG
ncbi:hydroxysteroid 11-beta-dehydrogenase 1-like protein isoform X2 [Stegostoma tigrinum]|uniref:hydroxysteroid 11-beta-dehydrogenase 1-like protein isoform X2 n=1 Tax=Stegostoma tigrinum TaxID=3053191 RepID=UPI00202B6C6E|nr:hydroxysteroid 11-beta-dehydrogenase 1-like protein isoform X2 [Stegostoma tigrinum]